MLFSLWYGDIWLSGEIFCAFLFPFLWNWSVRRHLVISVFTECVISHMKCVQFNFIFNIHLSLLHSFTSQQEVEREREIETDRQRLRDSERQTDRQTEKQTSGWRGLAGVNAARSMHFFFLLCVLVLNLILNLSLHRYLTSLQQMKMTTAPLSSTVLQTCIA